MRRWSSCSSRELNTLPHCLQRYFPSTVISAEDSDSGPCLVEAFFVSSGILFTSKDDQDCLIAIKKLDMLKLMWLFEYTKHIELRRYIRIFDG